MKETHWIGYASALPRHCDQPVLRRSLVVSFVVGPTLLFVNQGPGYFLGNSIDYVKVLLTFLVPFMVSCFSSTLAKIHATRGLSRYHDRLKWALQPVCSKVVQIETNALLVNQTAKARFEETTALLDQAHCTMQDLLNGNSITEQALQAIESVLLQFHLVLEADAEVRAEIAENLTSSKVVSSSITSAMEKFSEISNLAYEVGRIGHQTTLLSLNAAVAAATAGPEGKRFAVIAESVRHLARETEAQANAISRTTKELQVSALMMASDSERLFDSMGRLLVCSDKAGRVVLEAKDALLLSSEISKSSLQVQARQASDIQDIAQGIERVVDHASAAIDGSAKNAALAKEVSHSLDAILAQGSEI